MTDSISRRNAIKVLGAAGAGALIPGVLEGARPSTPASTAGPIPGAAPAEILPLTSTSGVFIPPRGRSYVKFSYDFPEPSVAFGDLRFGVMVYTHENAYGLDREKMTADSTDDRLRITANGLVWAGGQEKVPGKVVLEARRAGDTIEWDVTAECDRPIKSVTTVLRGVPRGRVAPGGGNFFDPRDSELLYGYPFSGGDLFGPGGAGGMTTPFVAVQGSDDVFFISSLDDKVRTKRLYMQPGENGYRVEALWEVEGWLAPHSVTVPTWRAGRAVTLEAALATHYDHVARAYNAPLWDTRPDVPDWMRDVALVTTLHGQHYTGYIFNDYARSLETMRWMATQIPADRVLVFLSSWDGRYYWDYPNYQVNERMGGAAGFKRLVDEGHRMGFHIMPMYGTNAANRRQAVWSRIADARTAKIDGDNMDLNWVDWDNDRHQEGWLSYMNPGVDSWRTWLTGRIADMIDRFGVDAYFLDIVGGWTNNTKADMHAGTRRMVMELRQRYPNVVCVGEMHYDALLEFIPMYHSGGGGAGGPFVQRYAKFFQHLSHPAPGRGSTGVHEAGFGRFNTETLSLSPVAIPTLNVVDDTFGKYRDLMAAVIAKAKERAGIG